MNDASRQTSPFLTHNINAYQKWRKWKLDQQQLYSEVSAITIRDPSALTPAEQSELRDRCAITNWALFRLENPSLLNEASIKQFASQLGLCHLDANLKSEDSGISAIQVTPQVGKPYIPYTSHRLSWHTDGYYNDLDQQIHGWLLYCLRQAAEGGANDLLDHELLYIKLRDEDPALIDALTHPEAMMIPANIEHGVEIRPDHSGPVFSIDDEGNLHMRYSARTRNIIWRDDSRTQRAVERITELLETSSVIHYRLQPGEGLVSNNILHRRDAFKDGETPDQQRLIYRARFYDRISGTSYLNR